MLHRGLQFIYCPGYSKRPKPFFIGLKADGYYPIGNSRWNSSIDASNGKKNKGDGLANGPKINPGGFSFGLILGFLR